MDEAFSNLLTFVDNLRAEGVTFRLSQARPTAIMVEVTLPRERWEVEFFANGSIEAERFQATDDVTVHPNLRELWATILGPPWAGTSSTGPRSDDV